MSGWQQFRDDDRGVVMIIGAVAAAFLIGAVWFIWGIGEAAVFRETMQSAADATAYQVSVYDARGMNLIAMINLIMSVVLTVLVVLRVIQALVVAVNIISCIFGAFFNPVCDATTAMEPEIAETVDTVAPIVNKVLTGLSLTESGISILWPFFATGTSVRVAGDYKPIVQSTVGLGTSNIPLQSALGAGTQVAGSAVSIGNFRKEGEKVLSAGNIKSNLDVGENGLFCNYGGKFLLPTSSDNYQNLCARAGANVVFAYSGYLDLLLGPLSGIPFVGALEGAVTGAFNRYAAPILGALIGQFSDFFCQDDSDALYSIAKMLVKGSGNKTSSDASLAASCSGKKKDPKATAAQIAKATQQCKDTLNRAKTASKANTNNAFGWNEVCPKTLYGNPMDVNFQNWGFSFGSYADRSAKIVGTATALDKKDKTVLPAPSKGADLQVAQSEFYYEPKTSNETQNQETAETSFSAISVHVNGLQSGLDNYMWNMRWRARLRRVRAPSVSVAGGLGAAFSQLASQIPGSGIDNTAISNELNNIAGYSTKVQSILSGAADKAPGQVEIGGELVSPQMVH